MTLKSTCSGPHLVKAVENGDLPQWRLDDMAIRILSSYYLLKQDEAFPSTNFNSWDLSDEATNQHVDVTADHGNLIRELGAASIVLLKNDGILPLTGPKQPRQLAVVGNCAGDSPLGPNQSGSGGPNIRIGETVPATPGVTAMGWVSLDMLPSYRCSCCDRARQLPIFRKFSVQRGSNSEGPAATSFHH